MGTGSRGTATSRSRPVAVTWAMVLAALLVVTSSPVAAEDVKRVLVLFPVSDGQPESTSSARGLRSALRATPGHPLGDLQLSTSTPLASRTSSTRGTW